MTTDYRSLADESLLRLIVHARPEALSELYDRYGRLVFSIAFNTVGDPASAEEITQDVFLRVWQRAAQYRAEAAKVSTWVSSIARHRAIDWLRRQGARPEGQSVAWADVSPEQEPAAEGAQQAAELAMQRQQVRAAVARLPEEQQRVLALAATDAAPGATGKLVISRDGEYGTLVADGLPALDAGHQYQVWLIRTGQHTSGGVFSVGHHGYGVIEILAPEPLGSYPSFHVTVEPSGGSPAPTGAEVLAGHL